MHPLILKCAMALRRSWRRRDSQDVVADGAMSVSGKMVRPVVFPPGP